MDVCSLKRCPNCNSSNIRRYTLSFGSEEPKKYVQCLVCAWRKEMKRTAPPKHYDQEIQPWDVIDAWRLDFWEGNAVKYICRAGKKENNSAVDDYNKAITYLQECIRRAQDG